MKIALLGYGKEGKSTENYFKTHFPDAEIDIFENFTPEEIKQKDFSSYDHVFRSPSVPPLNLQNETSVTKYFFDHCPCPIIGVTGTKGKGTTCSFIAQILEALGHNVHLVGNIGTSSIDVLDTLNPTDTIVYEMSSFQLWDLTKSPHIAVVLRIEADHLNVHNGYSDYVNAKSHIAEFQEKDDSIVYFKDNNDSVKIAQKSPAAHKYPYPENRKSENLTSLLNSLKIPGKHNQENAEAALLAVSAYLNTTLDALTENNFEKIKTALENFKGLPHHIEFVRTVDDVDYYDDSFSASYPSLEVALKSFPDKRVVLIAGGKDRGLDLAPIKKAIFEADNLEKTILIGETKAKLAENAPVNKYTLADTLENAVKEAKNAADACGKNAVVLLSPGAASFDMFKDFYDRGEQFKKLVERL
ncbi:UDP-N-acetylmuramoyl-L-alanine--D-glutamate ligase [Candidatus Saccharibacteria bacterium]|nr:UDP-N-acetylmuramoyl-L-alanine--D-glutamate ligase [Candidatus Saccharibacteria bacterium]